MSWSSGQLVELLVTLCAAVHFFNAAHHYRTATALAESKSGHFRPHSDMPIWLSVFIALAQAFIFFGPRAIYIFNLVCHGMQQPEWMGVLALPDVLFGMRAEGALKNTARVLACVVEIALGRLTYKAFKDLGDQYHPIGRRKKQRVVQTGVYAWVRHPLYSLQLLLEIPACLMFWSYAPMFGFIASVVVLAVRIPIEEESIQRDKVMKEEYCTYMKKVPSKLIPYVW